MNPARDQQLAELLVQARDGDPAAYERFLREISALLRAFLARRMASAGVEDVLQETLLSVHRARHSWLADRPIGPWLYAICEHRMAEFFRRHRRIQAFEVSTELRDLQVPDHAACERPGLGLELGDLVREALSKLPRKQRFIIECLKLRDLSVREVAVQTGISESAVKVTAFRGYEAIRKMLGSRRR